MLLFVLASSAVYAALAAVALYTGFDDLGREPRLMLSVMLSGWLVPTLATWITAELVHAPTKRRLLHRALSMPIRRIVMGLIAGVAGSTLGVLWMALLDRTPTPDAALTALSASIATLLIVLPSDRVRKGTCVHCGYNLAGATPAARGTCAECGANTLSPG